MNDLDAIILSHARKEWQKVAKIIERWKNPTSDSPATGSKRSSRAFGISSLAAASRRMGI